MSSIGVGGRRLFNTNGITVSTVGKAFEVTGLYKVSNCGFKYLLIFSNVYIWDCTVLQQNKRNMKYNTMLMTNIFEVVNYNTCSMKYMSKAFSVNIFTVPIDVLLYNNELEFI